MKKIKQKIFNKNYILYVANNDRLRRKGLSDLKSLRSNVGMLFIYDKEEKDRSFTMKKTNFDLRIIFLNNNDDIVYQEIGKKRQQKNIICSEPSSKVIEIKA